MFNLNQEIIKWFLITITITLTVSLEDYPNWEGREFCATDPVEKVEPVTTDYREIKVDSLGLDLAVFVDQAFIRRIRQPIDEVRNFVRYVIRTVELRFNEPSVFQVYEKPIKFRIVYYEESNDTLWPDGKDDGNLLVTKIYNRVKSYSVNHPNRSKYKWDHAIFLTGANTYAESFSIKTKRRVDVLGIANAGALCTGSVLIEMKDFNGVWVLIHEVGHAFGALHDQGPDCHDTNTIMSASTGPGKVSWSSCSLKAFASQKNSLMQCLARADNDRVANEFPGMKLPVDLPGQQYNRSEQCKMGYSESSEHANDDDSCKRGQCSLKWIRYDLLSPIEGTSCGTDKVCCIGKCIALQKCLESFNVK